MEIEAMRFDDLSNYSVEGQQQRIEDLELVGRAGMSEVYKARQFDLDRLRSGYFLI